jgi:alanine-glyoxylate transaminase/serine-glyoxylate transaminase/serine-pyruvate transaminase
LTPVTTVLAPADVSAAEVRRVLLDDFNIEIGGGLGEYVDRMWRIGTMGHSAQRANVMLLLAALEAALQRQGYVAHHAGVAAAEAVYCV